MPSAAALPPRPALGSELPGQDLDRDQPVPGGNAAGPRHRAAVAVLRACSAFALRSTATMCHRRAAHAIAVRQCVTGECGATLGNAGTMHMCQVSHNARIHRIRKLAVSTTNSIHSLHGSRLGPALGEPTLDDSSISRTKRARVAAHASKRLYIVYMMYIQLGCSGT